MLPGTVLGRRRFGRRLETAEDAVTAAKIATAMVVKNRAAIRGLPVPNEVRGCGQFAIDKVYSFTEIYIVNIVSFRAVPSFLSRLDVYESSVPTRSGEPRVMPEPLSAMRMPAARCPLYTDRGQLRRTHG
jgi:hypothetical protein